MMLSFIDLSRICIVVQLIKFKEKGVNEKAAMSWPNKTRRKKKNTLGVETMVN